MLGDRGLAFLKCLTVHMNDKVSVLLRNQFGTYQEIGKIFQASWLSHLISIHFY